MGFFTLIFKILNKLPTTTPANKQKSLYTTQLPLLLLSSEARRCADHILISIHYVHIYMHIYIRPNSVVFLSSDESSGLIETIALQP